MSSPPAEAYRNHLLVREMKHFIERLVVLSDKAVIAADDVRNQFRQTMNQGDVNLTESAFPVACRGVSERIWWMISLQMKIPRCSRRGIFNTHLQTLKGAKEALERSYIQQKLDEYRGDITKAAKAFGMPRI